MKREQRRDVKEWIAYLGWRMLRPRRLGAIFKSNDAEFEPLRFVGKFTA